MNANKDAETADVMARQLAAVFESYAIIARAARKDLRLAGIGTANLDRVVDGYTQAAIDLRANGFSA